MEFLYGTTFLSQSPEAYERLITDAMRGDATLFTRNDEVEAQWRICDPIVKTLGEDPGAAAPVPGGHAGSRRGGPAAARRGTPLAGHLGHRGSGSAPCRRSATASGARRTPRRADRGGAARSAGRAPRRERRATCRRACSTWCASSTASGAARSPTACARVGRYHASRTIVCAVEPRSPRARRGGHAWPPTRSPSPAASRPCARPSIISVGPEHLERIDTIVDPLVVTDLPTMVWSPHGHHRGRRRRCGGWRRSCCSTRSTSPTWPTR